MRTKLWLLGGLATAGILEVLLGASVAYAHGGIVPGQNILTAWKTNRCPACSWPHTYTSTA
jgi:hypothetical protein